MSTERVRNYDETLPEGEIRHLKEFGVEIAFINAANTLREKGHSEVGVTFTSEDGQNTRLNLVWKPKGTKTEGRFSVIAELFLNVDTWRGTDVKGISFFDGESRELREGSKQPSKIIMIFPSGFSLADIPGKVKEQLNKSIEHPIQISKGGQNPIHRIFS